MRHGKKFNKLGRTDTHRAAMLSNMAASLILHKRIETTLAKARALKIYVEPLLTRAKVDTTHNRRIIFAYLRDKETLKELFSTVSDKIADRPGGYTRIIKLGTRMGDNAETCMMELVDFNETLLAAAAEKAGKTRRSRRGGTKKAEGDVAVAATEPAVIETTAEVIESAPVTTVEDVSEAPAADNLEIIEGIGPKIAEIMVANGVVTFAQLADMTPDAIKEILVAAGPNFAGKEPETWPKQAELARDGKMDELKVLQDELNGGRA